MTQMWEPEGDSAKKTTGGTPISDSDLQKVQRAKLAAKGSYFGLMGLFTGDSILLLFQGAPVMVAIAIWLFRILPLCIFLPGIRNDNPRVYAWLSFAILLYFTHAVVMLLGAGNLIYATLYCLLCVAVFVSAVIYIRTARKYLGQNLMS